MQVFQIMPRNAHMSRATTIAAPTAFGTEMRSAGSVRDHLRRCADTVYASVDKTILEPDCASKIRPGSCGDQARRAHSGIRLKTPCHEGQVRARLEGHGRIRGIVCGMAGRADRRP